MTLVRRRIALASLTILAFAVAGCSTAPRSEQSRSTLETDTTAALDAFKNADPTLGATLGAAAGYAVFPSVGKAALTVGGAYGRGQVYEKDRMVGFCDLSQATIGLQLGAQTYRELIVFRTDEALRRFKEGKLAFSANASAVALKAGASTTADYSSGAAVFTMTTGGLMYEASIGGQVFTYEPR